ncbi:MAG: GtrA family protein [Clostridia bacterium]|nr:GtrA family protein [Clostridia bacterium]
MKEFLRTLKFVGFSISAGVIQVLVFTLLNELLKLDYWVSYLIALVCSVLWNFTFNRKFTFKSAANVPIAMLKVAAFYVVFTPFSVWFENFLTVQCGWNEYLATGTNMVINFVLEFLYQRFFVFGKSIDTAKTRKEKLLEKQQLEQRESEGKAGPEGQE